jgi:hypothetical protein
MVDWCTPCCNQEWSTDARPDSNDLNVVVDVLNINDEEEIIRKSKSNPRKSNHLKFFSTILLQLLLSIS